MTYAIQKVPTNEYNFYINKNTFIETYPLLTLIIVFIIIPCISLLMLFVGICVVMLPISLLFGWI